MRRSLLSVLAALLLLVAPVASAQVTSYPSTGAVSVLAGAGAPSTGTWKKGDLTLDTSSVLRVCTVAGTPGTWAVVSGAATTDTGTTSDDWTLNSDAVATANEDADLVFKSSTTDGGGLVATMHLLANMVTGPEAGLAYWIDDSGGAVAPTFTVGKPGDFTAVGDDVGAALWLRGHAAGAAVGTALEAKLTLSVDGRLTIASPGDVYIGGMAITTGAIDGLDPSQAGTDIAGLQAVLTSSHNFQRAPAYAASANTNVTVGAQAWDATNGLSYVRLTGGVGGGTASWPFSFMVPTGTSAPLTLRTATVWSDLTGGNAGTVTCKGTTGATILNAVAMTEGSSFGWNSFSTFDAGTMSEGGIVQCVISVAIDDADTVDIYGADFIFDVL